MRAAPPTVLRGTIPEGLSDARSPVSGARTAAVGGRGFDGLRGRMHAPRSDFEHLPDDGIEGGGWRMEDAGRMGLQDREFEFGGNKQANAPSGLAYVLPLGWPCPQTRALAHLIFDTEPKTAHQLAMLRPDRKHYRILELPRGDRKPGSYRSPDAAKVLQVHVHWLVKGCLSGIHRDCGGMRPLCDGSQHK